jgi:hypothetical protein
MTALAKTPDAICNVARSPLSQHTGRDAASTDNGASRGHKRVNDPLCHGCGEFTTALGVLCRDCRVVFALADAFGAPR